MITYPDSTALRAQHRSPHTQNHYVVLLWSRRKVGCEAAVAVTDGSLFFFSLSSVEYKKCKEDNNGLQVKQLEVETTKGMAVFVGSLHTHEIHIHYVTWERGSCEDHNVIQLLS